jgi:F-type H+-transporting ATPase subunit delta
VCSVTPTPSSRASGRNCRLSPGSSRPSSSCWLVRTTWLACSPELLSAKLSPPALDLLSFAVQDGAPAAGYTADVASLAAVAAARRDGLVPLEEGALGRTASTERVEGYATAVLTGLDQRRLGNVEEELFRFGRIVEGNDQLELAMTTAQLPAAARVAVARQLLSGRASEETERLAAYAARVGRPRDYPVLLDSLVQIVGREAGRRVADVRAAGEMTGAQQEQLAAALSRLTGRRVEVRVTLQSDLLGGFVATVGDTVVDASLRHRLERAKETLLAPPPEAARRTED